MKDQLLPPAPASSIGLMNIGVHGHFYQPLREDPFTGIIPNEEGAAPYPNFNEERKEKRS